MLGVSGGAKVTPGATEEYEVPADMDSLYYCGVPKTELFSTGDDGLDESEAKKRLDKFGHNELHEEKENLWLKFLVGFTGPMPSMIWLSIIIEFFLKVEKEPHRVEKDHDMVLSAG